MAINFALADRVEEDPTVDPLGRTWRGWDRTKSDQEVWETNRGVWKLSSARLDQEQLATFSYKGVIQLVAEFDNYEVVPTPSGIRKALLGRVLLPGDPVRDALVGRPGPSQRNPVGYIDTTELESLNPAERGLHVHNRPTRAFLVNHNPERWPWNETDYTDAVHQSSEGRIVRGQWSTGHRTSGLEPGDEVFLLRQGREPRGIIGSGRFASRPFQARHWDREKSGQANFALIDWEMLVPPDSPLPVEILTARLPGQHWSPQASGTEIHPDALATLHELWADHVGHPLPPRAASRQGWQMDPVRRKKVEDAAQERLMQYFRDAGWVVSDTRVGNPYDATAHKGGQVRYLEAKGTETQGRSVIVTRNEVDHARAHPGQCYMGILSDIQFDPDGELVPGSGRFVVIEWGAAQESLQPRTYDFYPAYPKS